MESCKEFVRELKVSDCYSSPLNQIPYNSPVKLLTALHSIRLLTILLTNSSESCKEFDWRIVRYLIEWRAVRSLLVEL